MTCLESVSSDGWHFHKCGKPARAAFVKVKPLLDSDKKAIIRCGIHARRYRNNEAWTEIPLDIVRPTAPKEQEES
jgi:hypothetical protein